MSSLPNFPSFPIHNEENSAGSRWSKWLSKSENMLCGLAIEDPKRKKAPLLHYIGDEGFDVYDSFTATQKGDENSYDTVKAFFTTYFTPRKNIVYETYKFRQTVQQKEESIDSFYRSPSSGELRTQKLKSHLVRTQSLNVLPLKSGVGQ